MPSLIICQNFYPQKPTSWFPIPTELYLLAKSVRRLTPFLLKTLTMFSNVKTALTNLPSEYGINRKTSSGWIWIIGIKYFQLGYETFSCKTGKYEHTFCIVYIDNIHKCKCFITELKILNDYYLYPTGTGFPVPVNRNRNGLQEFRFWFNGCNWNVKNIFQNLTRLFKMHI